MSKPGIETQVEKWLEGRGRWLRSGGDNLVRYLSVMLGNGDQVDDLVALLAADERPDWLYVEREGRRITLVGLALWRTDQAVEYDEVSDDAWAIVATQYAENARIQQQLETMRASYKELEALCSDLTDPSGQVALAVCEHEPVSPLACDHSELERELSEARGKVTALTSVGRNNQQVIRGLNDKVRIANKEARGARREAGTTIAEREVLARALLELVCLAITAPVMSGEVEDLARRQFMNFANMFKRVLDKDETRSVREVQRQLSA